MKAKRSKPDEKLVLQKAGYKWQGNDVMCLYVNKYLSYRAFAQQNPEKVIEIYEKMAESSDFGELRPIIYLAAINSVRLIKQMEKQFRNSGMEVLLCRSIVDETWHADAILRDGEVDWNV